MIEDLKTFCIIYIVTPRVILFSANSKSIHNWKQKLIIWNDNSSAEMSELLNCFLRTIINFWLQCRPLCLPVYLYLLKANFLFQWDFRVPKLKQIDGGKIFTPPKPQKRDVIIFTVSEFLFWKCLDFFAPTRKISLNGVKNYKKKSENFWLWRY